MVQCSISTMPRIGGHFEKRLSPSWLRIWTVGTAFNRGSKRRGRKRGHRSPASSVSSPLKSFELMGISTSFSRNQKIFTKGEPSEFLYKLESGCIRTYEILNTGRRWIDTFYLPGDFFGLDARKEQCQSALDQDPRSASKRDPLERRVLAVALAPSELAGVAETARARAA